MFASRFVTTVAAAIVAACVGGVAAADDEIVFGQSAALTGAASELGRGMRVGIVAAFEEANRDGGVHGRKLRLISRDDRYEPEQAIDNTRDLIENENVFALVGSVGTPTSRAAEPIATAAGVPYIGPFTGAQFLREPYRRTVINVRASYFQETERLVAHLAADRRDPRIAVIYQDDSFGRAGYDGVQQALERRDLAIVGEGVFSRNTVAVKRGILDVLATRPDAIVMVGPYEPLSLIVRWVRRLSPHVGLATISFVGTEALAGALGSDGAGVLISQVMPHVHDETLPLIAQFWDAIGRSSVGGDGNYVSLEGYAVGRFVVAALERAGPDADREAFLEAVFGGDPFVLGGLRLDFGPQDNQGSDDVFLTRIGPSGDVEPLSTDRADAR